MGYSQHYGDVNWDPLPLMFWSEDGFFTFPLILSTTLNEDWNFETKPQTNSRETGKKQSTLCIVKHDLSP